MSLEEIYYSGGGGDKPLVPEYIESGLIALFDGINNTGQGHSSSSLTWVDLTGNGYDLVLYGSSSLGDNLSWNIKSLGININQSIVQYFYSANKEFLPNTDFTLESCYRVQNHIDSNGNCASCCLRGNLNVSEKQLDVSLGRGSSSQYNRYLTSCTQHYEELRNNSIHPGISVNELVTTTVIKPYPYFYDDLDSRKITTYKNGDNKFNNYQCNYYSQYSGGAPSNIRIYVPFYVNFPYSTTRISTMEVFSIRLYNRRLSSEEVLYNYNIDVNRF